MTVARPLVLTLNAGSSSIRFACFDAADPKVPLWQGKLDRFGHAEAQLSVHGPVDAPQEVTSAEQLIQWLLSCVPAANLAAVGHRVVHGFDAEHPQLIDAALLATLRRMMPFDPDHLPLELQIIETVQRLAPQVTQIACFDTAFHRDLPRVAQILPIPRRYFAQGLRRYGFHGLSYQYLLEELQHIGEPAASTGRVILAHLGSGASVCAMLNGRSIDTSMAFTPTAGLVMGSRSGDLDPGILAFLARTEQMSIDAFQDMVNHDSGLLGISETSSDMRELLTRESRDERAADAVEMFCYQARKWIAAMAAALGGVDVLVFAGGIGESAPLIRERICANLGFLGVGVDAARNARGDPIISPEESDVRVRVIRTDEELMIARSMRGVLNGDAS